MPIVAADLEAFGSLNRPEDDATLTGGAIDIDNRPVFTQLAADDDLEVVSDNAGDTTQTVTTDGRDAAGAFVSEGLALNGLTIVTGTQVYERVLSSILDADAAGIITVRRQPSGATVGTIPVGERGFFALFIESASASGATTRFEKTFWQNNHGTLTLNSAQVQLFADPAAKIRQAVETAKNGSTTVANRLATPGGVSFVDDGVDQSVPGTTLEAASNIGVWWELALLADDAPIRNTFTARITGTSV